MLLVAIFSNLKESILKFTFTVLLLFCFEFLKYTGYTLDLHFSFWNLILVELLTEKRLDAIVFLGVFICLAFDFEEFFFGLCKHYLLNLTAERTWLDIFVDKYILCFWLLRALIDQHILSMVYAIVISIKLEWIRLIQSLHFF